MARRSLKIVGMVCGLTILLSATVGCLPGKATPKESYYDMPYVAPKHALKKPLLNGILGIARPETDGVHDNVRILFSYSDTPHSVNKHNYHLWQDAPSSLVQKRLRQYFTDVKLAKKVVFFEPGEKVDYILKSRIHRLERFVHRNKANKDEVIFAIEVKIISASDYKTVFSEVYFEKRVKTHRYNSGYQTVHASVEALGRAFKQTMDEFISVNMPKKNGRKRKKAIEKLSHSN